MKEQLIITQADNGFIVDWKDEAEDGIIEHSEVFEISDDCLEDKELETMKYLLKWVAEYFGVFYSKHSPKNLKIEIEERKDE